MKIEMTPLTTGRLPIDGLTNAVTSTLTLSLTLSPNSPSYYPVSPRLHHSTPSFSHRHTSTLLPTRGSFFFIL